MSRPDARKQAGTVAATPISDPLATTGWREHVPALGDQHDATLLGRVDALRHQGRTIYPPRGQELRALALTPWDAVRVVILGQDPYHGPGQAHGLAFSVCEGTPLPRSLRNIYKELAADLGTATTARPALPTAATLMRPVQVPPPAPSGDLTRWAQQGVLLLNTVLTVEDGAPRSHARLGWDELTRGIITALGQRAVPTAFLLWGGPARSYADLVRAPQHLVLEAAHPSPLSASRGFFGCRHFSQVNAWLQSQGLSPINW